MNCMCVCYFLHMLIFSTVLELLIPPVGADLLNGMLSGTVDV